MSGSEQERKVQDIDRVMGRARSSRLTRNKIESMFVQGIRQGAMHLRWLSKEIYYQT